MLWWVPKLCLDKNAFPLGRGMQDTLCQNNHQDRRVRCRRYKPQRRAGEWPPPVATQRELWWKPTSWMVTGVIEHPTQTRMKNKRVTIWSKISCENEMKNHWFTPKDGNFSLIQQSMLIFNLGCLDKKNIWVRVRVRVSEIISQLTQQSMFSNFTRQGMIGGRNHRGLAGQLEKSK